MDSGELLPDSTDLRWTNGLTQYKAALYIQYFPIFYIGKKYTVYSILFLSKYFKQRLWQESSKNCYRCSFQKPPKQSSLGKGISKMHSAIPVILPHMRNVWHIHTPSSSSMISFPIEASVVHLQLLVARTAHRLWALNLHTRKERGGGGKKNPSLLSQ